MQQLSKHILFHTNNTEFMHPSNYGLFVTWAYLLHTTFPVCVTNPNSEIFTSIIVPIS